MSDPSIPIALTIAGSDSGGGAGIQADLKTFHAFGVFGTSAVTAVTAQNTTGVHSIHTVPIDTVVAQIDAVAVDLRPTALKTGMLATAGLVTAVAEAIRRHRLEKLVVDPVMVATSGDRLLERDAERAIVEDLLPLSDVITPNIEESSILTGTAVRTVADMAQAARRLVEMGAAAALVKGGHMGGEEVVDVLWDGSEERAWRRTRTDTPDTHGTGCTLSAAMTAGLARGDDLSTATDRAVRFIGRAIDNAPGLGTGRGPVDHFAPVD